MVTATTNKQIRVETVDNTAAEISPDLQAILDAWHQATERLRQTHETLRSEVARLTDELERKNRELQRKNRLTDIGRMASHVAHEVRNSLVPMALYLSLLKRQSEGETSMTTIQKLEAGFTTLETTVNDLLNFTTSREPHWQGFDLHHLVVEVLESVGPQLVSQGIAIEMDMESAVPVTADRNMLHRAVLNVILNAVDAMPQGGTLHVTSWQGPRGTELEIADSGPGIDLDDPSSIFEPFFTTKSDGTGLGLAIVDHILTAHHGRASALNCPTGGAAITLSIPHRQTMEAAA